MRGRILMTGKKDTKTGLWMLPLSIDESTISPSVTSMISQVALDVLQPIEQQPIKEPTAYPPKLASTSCRHEDAENNVFFCVGLKIHIHVYIAKTQEVKMACRNTYTI